MESNDCVNLSVRKKSLELKNKNDDGIIKHHGNQNWFTGSIIDMQCNEKNSRSVFFSLCKKSPERKKKPDTIRLVKKTREDA